MPGIPASSTDDQLRAIVASVLQLNPDEIGDDASFYDDLGADSLERVAITTEIEMKFGVTLSADETARILSLAEARAVLATKDLPGHSPTGDAAADGTATANAAAKDPGAGPTNRDPVGPAASAQDRPSRPGDLDLVHRLVGRQLEAGRGAEPAYLDPDAGPVSYEQLHRAAARYADALDAAAVPIGGRCLVLAEDSVATVIAVLGLWWYGCVPIPVSPTLARRELDYVLTDSGAEAVHGDGAAGRRPDFAETFAGLARFSGEAVRAELAEQSELAEQAEPARPGNGSVPDHHRWPAAAEVLVQYTSGSTGGPKGVRQSAAGILAMLDQLGQAVRLRDDDVVLATGRLSFGYGFGSSLLCTLDAGACAVLIRGSVDVHVVNATIERHSPTVICSVPRLYLALLELSRQGRAVQLGSVRLCLSAGENCSTDLLAQIRQCFGAECINCLGATELMHIAVTSAGSGMGNVGRPIPGTTATLRDVGGALVTDGEQGRLHLAGPTVALGYLNRDDEQARTFADGGAYTGDIAYRQPDGTLQYVCRADDLLNLGGYKVAPREIEEVVRAVVEVDDCVVVGVSDDAGLDQAVAYVVAGGADPQAVRAAILRSLRANLAAYKRPARIELMDALPVTRTGKVAAYELRERAVRS